jgi:hypothetical protein
VKPPMVGYVALIEEKGETVGRACLGIFTISRRIIVVVFIIAYINIKPFIFKKSLRSFKERGRKQFLCVTWTVLKAIQDIFSF